MNALYLQYVREQLMVAITSRAYPSINVKPKR